ncbi:MAG: N-acetylglucosamine-phosphate uridyltransferase [Bryobacterales bacterium]|jgi:acetyltransferase-like isoleucine patch superfamily enzyme|nr:N-acetylglucosamine-phosphate uridyltransferase [Bryobacterales bacterium]
MAPTYIHPGAIVDTLTIGTGTRIWAFTHVLPGVSIGDQCNIGEHCFLETGAVIGNNVTIKNGNQIWEGVTVGDGAFIGPNVSFTNDLYPRSARLPEAEARYADKNWLTPTVIERGASIGAGAIIVAGRTVGEFALVGAGTLVTQNVPPYAIVVGVPARRVGWVCKCGRRLHFGEIETSCVACGLNYIRKDDLIGVEPYAPPAAARV